MPQPKCSKTSRSVICRQDGRRETLDVAVLVAGHGTDVVGRDDPATALIDPPQAEDHAESGQLIVVEPDRGPARARRSLVEGAGVDGRAPGRIRSTRHARRSGPPRPRCMTAVWSESRGRAGPYCRGGRGRRRRDGRGRTSGAAGAAELGAWGCQAKVSGGAGQRDARTSGREELEQRGVERGFCPRPALRRDHDRDPPLDQHPEMRGQLIERAGPDQLHDGARFGRRGLEL